MAYHHSRGVVADRLSADAIASLKQAEAENRDRGAASYEERLAKRRGVAQLTAEAAAYLLHLAPKPSHAVLDAGAGVGRLALMLAPQVDRITCTDISEGALSVLRANAVAKAITNVEAVHADVCHLPPGLGPFDSAYSVEVLQHVPSHHERLAALQSMRDLLKPGGKCLVSVIRWRRFRSGGKEKEGYWGEGDRKLYAYHFTVGELRSLMKEAQFRDVQMRGLLVLPRRLTRWLPFSVSRLEVWCSRVPFFARFGRYVVAIGRR